MTEYEVVRHIKNQCPNNQMRDISFDEVCTDDPGRYVRELLRDRAEAVETQRRPDGTVTVQACCDGLVQEFVFTPI